MQHQHLHPPPIPSCSDSVRVFVYVCVCACANGEDGQSEKRILTDDTQLKSLWQIPNLMLRFGKLDGGVTATAPVPKQC